MENKPIIILGGGLWGNLLAYRLSQQLPHIQFKLYGTPNPYGDGNTWTFRENEISKESLKWVKPFISYSWSSYQLISTTLERTLKSKFSTIFPGQFEIMTRKSHALEKLGPDMTMEDLLEESAFIIDTRPDPRQKTKCVRHTFGLIVELCDEHNLDLPVAMDSSVRQDGILRHLQFLPLNPHTLLVKDIRYTKETLFDVQLREEELLCEIGKRWKIKEVLHHETESVSIPSGKIGPWNNGRVISLAGLMNPVNGDQFTEAVRLIDLMVATSFRLGELKEVIHRYRNEKENTKRFSRMIVKMLYHSPQPGHRLQILDYLFSLPTPSVEKFLDGKMGMMDVSRALLGNPPFPLMRALGSVIPEFHFKLPNLSTKHQ